LRETLCEIDIGHTKLGKFAVEADAGVFYLLDALGRHVWIAALLHKGRMMLDMLAFLATALEKID